MNRPTLSALSALAIASLLIAACSSPGADGSPGSDGISHPTGSDEPVLIVSSSGGFVPLQFMATNVPAFALYGDGRVIVQGATTLIFPGPALPPLLERTLTAAGIQEVLEAVLATGLFEEDLRLDGAQAFVADASDTVFTLNADGRQVTVSVYALGFFSPDPAQLPPDVEMRPAELEAHRELQQLLDRLTMIDTTLAAEAWAEDAWRPFEPDAFRLYVRDNTDDQLEGGDVRPTVREWPAETGDPAEFGEAEAIFGDGTRCGVVEGDLAQVWFEELSAATQLTYWADPDGGRRYQVSPRPVLPHEDPACPEVLGA